jgi:hypothetical protein
MEVHVDDVLCWMRYGSEVWLWRDVESEELVKALVG